MDLHLTCDARDHVRLFVNGALVAEIAVGQCDTRDTLVQEVSQARCLWSLGYQVRQLAAALTTCLAHPDHAHKGGQAQEAALLRGFLAGLQGRTVPHPGGDPLVARVLPEPSRTYGRGWELGDALVRAARGAEGKEKELQA